MGALLQTLSVAFRGETTQLDTALAKSGQNVNQFSTAINKAGQNKGLEGLGKNIQLDSSLEGIGKSATGVGSMMKIAGGAIAAGVQIAIDKIKELVEVGRDWINQSNRLAGRFSDSAHAMGGLMHAAVVSGVGVDDMTTALTHLEKSISEAATSGGEAAVIFNRLGLNAQDLQMKPVTEQLEDVAEAISKTGTAADKINFQMKLMGKGGASMSALMKNGAEGIKQARLEAERFGLTVNKDIADSQKNAGRSGRVFTQAMTGIGTSFASAMAPLSEAFNSELAKWGGALAETIKGWTPYWVEAGRVVGAFIKMISEMMGKFGKSISDAFASIGQMLGISKDTWNSWRETLLRTLFDLEYGFGNWGKFFELLWNRFIGGFTVFVNDVIHFFTSTIPELVEGKSWGELTERKFGKLEKELFANEERLKNELYGMDYQKWMANKFDKFNNPTKGGSEVGMSDTNATKATAAEYGSKEAFSIIAGSQRDKMFNVANAQLAENKKMREGVEKLLKEFQGNKLKLVKAR